MRSVNKVILIGNLTRDPELKTTASGQAIATFGLATNRQWTTSSGEKRNSAEFHECVAWAKLAEICKDYIRKGMLVYVEGYLKTRSWDMEDGTRRFRTEVVLQDMIILEKRGDGGGGDYVPSGDEAETDMGAEATPAIGSSMGDDTAGDDSTGDDTTTDDAATDETVVAEEAAPAEAPAAEAPAAEEAAPAETPAVEPAAGEVKADIDDDNLF